MLVLHYWNCHGSQEDNGPFASDALSRHLIPV